MDTKNFAQQLRLARVEGGAFLLPPRSLIRLSGSDAFRYLHGQVTRDLSRLAPHGALEACILTPKGKLCASLLIWQEGEDFILESSREVEEGLIARLERYVVADDVTITKVAPRSVIHYFGNAASELELTAQAGLRVSRLGVPGVDLEVTETTPLSSGNLLDPVVVGALRIERCLPAWGSELDGDLLPPEAGLDRSHIDYDRGCYPGQEVISRIKSVGRVNRQLHLLVAVIEAEVTLQAGQVVLSGEGTEVGTLTSISPQFDTGLMMALAFLKRDFQQPLFTLDPLTGERRVLTIIENPGP